MSRDGADLRVLFSILGYHPVVGGTERFARQLAARLRERGCHPEIVTAELSGEDRHDRVDGIPVHRVYRHRGSGVRFAAGYCLSAAGWLLPRTRRFDIVQAFYLYLDALVLAAVPLRGAPLIVRTAGTGASGDLARIRSMGLEGAARRLASRIDAFIGPSEESLREISELGVPEDRRHLVPNGVDTDRFSPSRAEADALRETPWKDEVEAGSPLVTLVSRLSPEKGVDVALRAWKRAGSKGTGMLVIAGDGPRREALGRLASDLGIADRVRFLGTVDRPEILLRHSELFLLPSRAEGISNALLEAMATGLPCIASDIPGNREVITPDHDGVLVAPDSPQQLGSAIDELLGSPDRARELGRRARETVLSRHSIDSVADSYLALYHSLLGHA